MLIKTPTRSHANRKTSKALNRSAFDHILASSSSKRSNSKSQIPYLLDPLSHPNPQHIITNYHSKKTVSSKERTHSTKASKHTRAEASFEAQQHSQKRKKSAYSYVSSKKQRTTYENMGYSKGVIEEMVSQRKKIIEGKRKENQEMEKLLKVLEVSRESIRKRKALIEHSRIRLNESWRVMCTLLDSSQQSKDCLGQVILPRAVDFLVRQQMLLQKNQQVLAPLMKG